MPARIKTCARRVFPSPTPSLPKVAMDTVKAKPVAMQKAPKDAPKTIAAKLAAHAKAAVPRSEKACLKATTKAGLKAAHKVKIAARQSVFEALVLHGPHEVIVTNKSMFTKSNWQVEEDSKCPTCGWARIKGCLCV